MAVRADGSILVTVLNHKQLWYVPAPASELPVSPVLVHTFDSAAMGIVEHEPDVFYVCTPPPPDGIIRPAQLLRIDLSAT